MKVLVFNCGSSTLKFEWLELESARAPARKLAHGIFERIGRDNGRYRLETADGHCLEGAASAPDHPTAALRTLDWLKASAGGEGFRPDAVAHRVVHGGEEISAPAVIDETVMRALERASGLAPLHNPVALATIRAVGARLGGIPSVVVADTAFHQTLPAHARMYAIPPALAARHGIRRYGFHGIGHAWMMERYAELSATAVARLNLITLHLGAGCSAAAIREGRSVETSMGLTPLEGLVMATRSGDLDPAVVTRLQAAEGLAPGEVERILNRESGLLGVSGLSADMRELERAAETGHERAKLAIEMFCHRVRKYVGAYLAALGRADAIIFGAGIGEHDARVRTRICAGLERLGIELDPALNEAASGREARISREGSPVALWVIPVNEELYIARAASRLLPTAG